MLRIRNWFTSLPRAIFLAQESLTWRRTEESGQQKYNFKKIKINTLSPFALFIALRGLKTLKTLRIFTTEIALDLGGKEKNDSVTFKVIDFITKNNNVLATSLHVKGQKSFEIYVEDLKAVFLYWSFINIRKEYERHKNHKNYSDFWSNLGVNSSEPRLTLYCTSSLVSSKIVPKDKLFRRHCLNQWIS